MEPGFGVYFLLNTGIALPVEIAVEHDWIVVLVYGKIDVRARCGHGSGR